MQQGKILWNSNCVSSVNAYAYLPLKYNQHQNLTAKSFWKTSTLGSVSHVSTHNSFLVSTIPSGPAQTCHCFCPAHGRWNSIQNLCRTYNGEKTPKTGVMLVQYPPEHLITVTQSWHTLHCLMLPRSAIYTIVTDLDMTTGTTRGISMYFCSLSPPKTGRTEMAHLNQKWMPSSEWQYSYIRSSSLHFFAMWRGQK